MTGTINPDGMVGFVGSIPQKINAFIKFAESENLKSDYEVITPEQPYKSNNIKDKSLKRVKDIYGAYEALTGIKLPRYLLSQISQDELNSLSKAELKLDKAVVTKVRDTSIDIKEKSETAKGRVERDQNEFPWYFRPLISKGNEYYADFTAASAKGDGNDQSPRMYSRIVYGNAIYNVLELYLNDVKKGIIQNNNLNADQKMKRLVKLIEGKIQELIDSPQGSNVKGLEKDIKNNLENLSYSSAIDAYTNLARLNSQVEFYTDGESWNKFFKNVEDDKLIDALAFQGLMIPELINLQIKYAKFNYSIGSTSDSNAKITMDSSKAKFALSLVRLLEKGGKQNLNFIKAYVDELVNRKINAELPEKYYILLKNKDKLEKSEETLSDELSKAKTNEKIDDLHKIFEPLGYAVSLFIDSSILVQKHYSLGVTPQAITNIEKLEPQEQQNLSGLLEFGKNESNILVNRLRDKNIAIDVPVFNHLQADSWKDSTDLSERFYSVSGFWDSNLGSRLSLFLAK
jgi:hypothetical protein